MVTALTTDDGCTLIRVEPLNDDLLAVAYLKAKDEGLLGQFFWESWPELIPFLEWCHRKDNQVVGCFEGDTLAGVGSLILKTRCGRLYGDVSELFFKEFQVKGITAKLGQALLEYAFKVIKVKCVYGITPEKNIPALRFMRTMGFSHGDPVPGLCSWFGEECGGYVSWLSKDEWEARRQAA